MASSASVVRTFHRATTLSSRLAAARPYSACLHTSAILRAEVSNKDPQLGDYPELPFVNLQERKYDPRWWDPQEKRNFGEVVSIRFIKDASTSTNLILIYSCMSKTT
jgi:hypothetical protein